MLIDFEISIDSYQNYYPWLYNHQKTLLNQKDNQDQERCIKIFQSYE